MVVEASHAEMLERHKSAALDDILGQQFPVLDHGFIRVIDYMGNDEAVVQAARVSYGQGTRNLRDDRALIRYLLSHSHSTPFEMAEIKMHVKLPIFVARQWIRHRTASVNEYSARYSLMDEEFYIPGPAAIAEQSASNRQGRGQVLAEEAAGAVMEAMEASAKGAFAEYKRLVAEGGDRQSAVARELARIVLPVSCYTQWYWKTDLHNLLRFLELRMGAHAQWEIRQYAEAIAKIVERWVPHTWQAFADFRLERTELSAAGTKVVRGWLAGEEIAQEESGLSQREWDGLCERFGRGSSS